MLSVTAVVAQDAEPGGQTSGSLGEQEDADSAEVEESGGSVPETPEKAAPQRKFKPTEEISEDLSIPFPVDI